MFIYRKISGKQVGRTANTVLPVLCLYCVLLMGLPAGVSLISHQITLADAVAAVCYAVSGDNCRGEHCSPASLTKLLLFRNRYSRKSEGLHHAPQRVEKSPSAKQTPTMRGRWRLRQRWSREGNTPSSTCKGQLLFSHSILL